MLAPEQLFQIRLPQQTTSPMMEIVVREVTLNVNAATIAQDIYTVPADRVLILENVHVHGEGAGAAVALSASCSFKRPNISAGYIWIAEENSLNAERVAGFTNINLDWHGQLYLPPLTVVQGQNTWTVNDPGNTSISSMVGMLIPSGNIASN